MADFRAGTPTLLGVAICVGAVACAGATQRATTTPDDAHGEEASAGGAEVAASTETVPTVAPPPQSDDAPHDDAELDADLDVGAALAITPDAERLAEAFAERLTVSRRRDGTRVLTPHCRNGPVPCDERLRVFAALIIEVATAHDVDPILIAAMAIKESGLDPSALGRRREAGIIQLHPRGAGRGVRYVQDAAYRARCQRRVDACQREVLERGVQTLARGMAQCGGLRGGLGAYASGHCTTRIRYIDRVLEERARLRRTLRALR